eukprot:286730_1
MNHLDQHTKDIVFGYIRQNQNILAVIIPLEVSKICLVYIDTHFMDYYGAYQWMITAELLEQMRVAENGQEFISDEFTIDGLTWCITAYPNGDSPDYIGDFSVYLNPLKFPKEWKSIIMDCTVYCHELQTGDGYTGSLSGDTESICVFDENTCRFEELEKMKFKQMSIVVRLRYLQIVSNISDEVIYSYDVPCPTRKHCIEWKIPVHSMTISSFISKVYYGIWVLQIAPRVKELDENISVAIRFCATPKNVACIHFVWKFKINELNVQKRCKAVKLSFDSSETALMGSGIMFEQLQGLNCITLHVDITILEMLNEYDTDIFLHHIQQQKLKLIERRLYNIEEKLSVLDYKNGFPMFFHQQRNVEDSNANVLNKIEYIERFLMNIEDCKYSCESGEQIKSVKIWLENVVGLPQYYLTLIENGFDDFESIRDINSNDLIEIGIDKLGHRKKIMKYASNLNINKYANESC